jgi:hypothetical protein
MNAFKKISFFYRKKIYFCTLYVEKFGLIATTKNAKTTWYHSSISIIYPVETSLLNRAELF